MFSTKEATNLKFILYRTCFASHLLNVFWVTILYKYLGSILGKVQVYLPFWLCSLPVGDGSRGSRPKESFRPTQILLNSVCPRSSDPFSIVTFYIKWVTTSWKDGRLNYTSIYKCITNGINIIYRLLTDYVMWSYL